MGGPWLYFIYFKGVHDPEKVKNLWFRLYLILLKMKNIYI